MKIVSKSAAQTTKLASKIAKSHNGGIFALHGDLGAGKTTFVKGFAQGLGIPVHHIKSPTYTLIREYKIKNIELYHFDFYRIETVDDLIAHDLQEIFHKCLTTNKKAYCVIEWPERVKDILPKKIISLYFEYKDEATRYIHSEDI